jgi:CheY-like chemotaxis protein
MLSTPMPRVLIVDDDPDMAELLGHMADIIGFEHQYVPTGVEAIEACAANPPDVIILDVMLEETDGWAVYKQLAPLTNAPIIFITAWRTGENRQRAEAMRADGFLAKPISHQDFSYQLKSVVGRPARRLQKA